jgi:transcriptional repressor NrdR
VYCPYCRHQDSRVIDSRTGDDGAAIRRRRACPACGRRFTTQETVILTVAKRSGVTEPFNRDKIAAGVRRACQGRRVTEDQLALLAQQVEELIRSRGCGEIPSHEVGLAILGPLRDLDEVAYLRFASVYRGFESLADFEEVIAAGTRTRARKRSAVAGPGRSHQPATAPSGGTGISLRPPASRAGDRIKWEGLSEARIGSVGSAEGEST